MVDPNMDPEELDEALQEFLNEISERGPETEYDGSHEAQQRIIDAMNRKVQSTEALSGPEAKALLDEMPRDFLVDMHARVMEQWADVMFSTMLSHAEVFAKIGGLPDISRQKIDAILAVPDESYAQDGLSEMPELMRSFLNHMVLWLEEVITYQDEHRDRGTG